MKKLYLKILGVVTVVCCCAGLLVNVVSPLRRFAGAFSAGRDSADMYQAIDGEAFEAIEATLTEASFELSEGDSFSVEIASQKKDGGPAAEIVDGALRVTQSSKRSPWGWGAFSFGSQNDRVHVTVPKGQTLQTVFVRTDTGSVRLQDVAAKETTIRTDVGAISCAGCDLGETEIRSDVGSVNLSNVALTNATIRTDVGGIEATISGARDRYALELSTDVGSVKVDGEKYAGEIDGKKQNAPYLLKIATDVGAIDLHFEE